MVAFRLGELGAAAGYLEQALEAQGQVAEVLSNLGAVYLELATGSAGSPQREAYQRALVLLTQAIKLDPDQPNIHTNIALAYILAGEMSKAEQCLDHALALNPIHPEALFHKAQFLYDKGSLADSLRLIDTILEHDPDQQEARAQRNLILDRLSF